MRSSDVLDAQIARLRRLEALPARCAPAVGDAVDAVLLANIAAGRDPDGKPWPLTKDGERALTGAGAALTVRATSGAVVARLEGVEARHDLGAVRGGVRRQILPRAGRVPSSIAEAVEAACSAEFARAIGGTP